MYLKDYDSFSRPEDSDSQPLIWEDILSLEYDEMYHEIEPEPIDKKISKTKIDAPDLTCGCVQPHYEVVSKAEAERKKVNIQTWVCICCNDEYQAFWEHTILWRDICTWPTFYVITLICLIAWYLVHISGNQHYYLMFTEMMFVIWSSLVVGLYQARRFYYMKKIYVNDEYSKTKL